jgi:hypothetical protein
MLADVTNNNGAPDAKAINNNNNAPGVDAINNNNNAADANTITNNNGAAMNNAAATEALPIASQAAPIASQAAPIASQAAPMDNNNNNDNNKKADKKRKQKKSTLEIRASAETMVDQDEMNFLIRFANNQDKKFFDDLNDLQANIDNFKKALIAMNIPDEDFSVKENVDQFRLLKRYLEKLVKKDDKKDEKKDDKKDDKKADANADAVNQPVAAAADNNNMANAADEHDDDMDMKLDDFDLNALFYVTVRDNQIAQKLVDAAGQFKGVIEDVSFSISERKQNEERAQLMLRAIKNGRDQAEYLSKNLNWESSDLDFDDVEINNFSLVGQVMNIAINMKIRGVIAA